ncbi:MAG TPA: 50S ribosomal protein L17 [Coriobacteriia bacterium]|jgi:large subunit ribosomal protein L17
MRHLKKGRQIGSDAAHGNAILRSLALALLTHERIKTTEMRAKEVRGLVDRIITWGKKGDVHSRRLIIAALGGEKKLVNPSTGKQDLEMSYRVIHDIAPRFADRPGGYTRILKLGPRKGDNASMVILEFVD